METNERLLSMHGTKKGSGVFLCTTESTAPFAHFWLLGEALMYKQSLPLQIASKRLVRHPQVDNRHVVKPTFITGITRMYYKSQTQAVNKTLAQHISLELSPPHSIYASGSQMALSTLPRLLITVTPHVGGVKNGQTE